MNLGGTAYAYGSIGRATTRFPVRSAARGAKKRESGACLSPSNRTALFGIVITVAGRGT